MPTDSKPRREYLPLDTIARALDPRLQLRRGLTDADGNPALWSEVWVQNLLSAHEDGATFPPLGLVREAKPKGEQLYLFSGWHRYAMWTRVPGVGSVECEVFEGDFLLALRKAAVENTTFGLNRSAECCRAAFEAVFLNDQLREEIIRTAPGNGGITRGLARACGVGKAVIPKYLAAFGYRADRKERCLVPVDPAPAVVPPAPAPHLNGHHTTNGHAGKNGTHHHAGLNGHLLSTEADADPDPAGPVVPTGPRLTLGGATAGEAQAAELVAEAGRHIRAINRLAEAVLAGPLAGDFRALCLNHLVPLEVTEQLPRNRIGEPPAAMVKVEWWPVMSALAAVFADLNQRAVARGAV